MTTRPPASTSVDRPRGTSSWRRRLAVLALVLAAFGIRLAAHVRFAPDDGRRRGYDYYVEMAENVVGGRGFHRTMPYGQGDHRAIRTPLYPLLLALMLVTPGPFDAKVAAFGAACGAATVLLSWLLARRLFGARAAWIAGTVMALWPMAVIHDTALQDTALYTALFMGTVVMLHEAALGASDGRGSLPGAGRAAVGGALAAAAVLTRVALLPTVVALIAWTALTRRRRDALVVPGAALLALGVGLAPWIIRNVGAIGAPVLTSDVGRSAWLGNNAELFSVYPRQSIDRAEERAWLALPEAERARVRQLGADELKQDAWFRERALAHVRAHPLAALVGAARKAWATFSPWRNPVGRPLEQAVHLVSYGTVLLLALASAFMFRRRWRELAPVGIAVALLALQSAVFFGHSAYRYYVDPLLIVLAAGFFARELPETAREAVP